MKIPQLKETCGGFSLRTGSLFISWLSVILGVISTASSAVLIYYTYFLENFNYSFDYDSYESDSVMKARQMERIAYRRNEKTMEMGMYFILFIIHGIISLFLLIGIQKRKLRYMLPWIWASGIAIVLYFLTVFNLGWNERGIDRDNFRLICVLALHTYVFLIVYSYYKLLKMERSSNNNLKEQVLTHESILATDDPIKPTDPYIA
ncbi:uncharacterized protein LOC142331154 [Lycorma delicatula]|uniref:uncharacterized protein LOC142331154 n=1 Tax=Lycorma delicatula TaxID=130591 RepID=UPI003F50F913